MTHSRSFERSVATCLAGVLVWALVTKSAHGGISPENVIVVVNADSDDSRTIANHYIDLRDIPTSNVILLEDVPTDLMINLPTFKEKILSPVFTQIDARGLANHTRVIAYSAGFPTTVQIGPHAQKLTDPGLRKVQLAYASLTGATYFFRMIMADNPSYLSLSSNLYSRGEFNRHFQNPFLEEKAERFDKAKENLELLNWLEGAEEFEALFKEAPTLAALAIKSAEGFAEAGKQDEALRMLKTAIQAGWWSGTYIKKIEAFAPLLEDPQIKAALEQMSSASLGMQGPVGFSGGYGWTVSGERIPVASGGISYLASCMLAVTHQRGSLVSQSIESLRRAAEADRTFPKGEFRFALTSDVRTKTRLPAMANALAYLAEQGQQAEIFREVVPKRPGNVLGLMLGTPKMDLDGRQWNLVPGAIAENLTSTSGDFRSDGQTKFTELLNAGAAMSSGSVAEPYAIQAKFPLPMMYGYYVDGVTAIEAFYLSIHSPYQTLIVGDPLCQPFARAPNEWIRIALSDSTPRVVQFERRPLALDMPSTLPRLIEIYVEGKLIKQSPPVAVIRMNLPEGISGAAEVRAVMTGIGPTETRLWFSQEFDLQGNIPTPTAKITKQRDLASSDESALKMTFSLACEGADSIDLMHLDGVLATVDGDQGEVTFDTKPLGSGPLRFQAIAHFGENKLRGLHLVDRPR